MSKKNIEKYIPEAISVLEETFEGGTIPSAYNGYISSFGASIVQSGLKPTLALFEDTNKNSKEDKSYLPKIILQILDKNAEENSLLKYILKNKSDEAYIKQQILDIAVAVKLSIRTFKLKKGE